MILKGILLVICCSFLSLLLHIVIIYFRKAKYVKEPRILALMRQTKLLLAIWFFIFLIYVVLFYRLPEKIEILVNKLNNMAEIINFGYGIIFYLFLTFIYLTIYYLVDRSVSATIIEMIDNAPGKRLTIDEIKKIYDVERKYQTELKGMLEGGFIIKGFDYYKNSFKGFLYARMAVIIKSILKFGPGG